MGLVVGSWVVGWDGCGMKWWDRVVGFGICLEQWNEVVVGRMGWWITEWENRQWDGTYGKPGDGMDGWGGVQHSSMGRTTSQCSGSRGGAASQDAMHCGRHPRFQVPGSLRWDLSLEWGGGRRIQQFPFSGHLLPPPGSPRNATTRPPLTPGTSPGCHPPRGKSTGDRRLSGDLQRPLTPQTPRGPRHGATAPPAPVCSGFSDV